MKPNIFSKPSIFELFSTRFDVIKALQRLTLGLEQDQLF